MDARDILNFFQNDAALVDVLSYTVDELAGSAIAIVLDHQTVVVSVDDEDCLAFDLVPPRDYESVRSLATEHPFHSALGGRVVWAWELRNQQGYMDALQVEVRRDDGITITCQFVAMASRLWLREVSAPREI
jgi:Family of unknown function (DUF6334)